MRKKCNNCSGKAKQRNISADEYIDYDEFNIARKKILGTAHNDKGIGTLSEKTLHAVLKNYYEPDEDKHEVAIDGYYADIFNDSGIIEIQTRQLNKLRDKLAVFLEEYHVTVVYPCAYNKWISWIDPESGDISAKRKSPRHYTEYDAFFELYKIKNLLKHPNLSVHLVLMDIEEYKLLNGWNYTRKRGATRYDRVPLGVRKIVELDRPEDYMQFVPYDLPEQFTAKDFAKHAKIPVRLAQTVLLILTDLEIVVRVGKQGKSYLYEVNE